ncbi:MAG: hypothetical protein QOE27_217, partial [Solirubrobacteraceae bacterium]|nr:hypothetical protein [Solirubrobacteraceae bacterium]
IVALPVLYVAVPAGVLTGFLVITFMSALMIALRPLVSTRVLWIAIPVLLTANLLVTRSIAEIDGGLQIYWVLTSIVVMIAAVGIANLYIQGGLVLRQIAYFTLFLAVYDTFFTKVVALTPVLAISLQGRPLDPSFGSRRPATTPTSASATCSSSACTRSPPTRGSDGGGRSWPCR